MTAQQLIDTVQQLQANMQQAQQRELTLRQQVEQLLGRRMHSSVKQLSDNSWIRS